MCGHLRGRAAPRGLQPPLPAPSRWEGGRRVAQGPRRGAVASRRAWPEPSDGESSSVWLAEAKSGNPTRVPTHARAASQDPRAAMARKAAARNAPAVPRCWGWRSCHCPGSWRGREALLPQAGIWQLWALSREKRMSWCARMRGHVSLRFVRDPTR